MQTPDQSSEEQRAESQSPISPAVETPSYGESEEAAHNLKSEHESLSSKDSAIGIHSMTSIDNEAIRQGLIYPPPPSFYEKDELAPQSQDSPSLTPPPPAQSSHQAAPYVQGSQAEYVPLPQANNAQQAPQGPYPPYPYPAYLPGQYPAPPPTIPTAPKKSYRWVWLLVSALVVLLLATCGVCAWASSSLFGDAFQQASAVVYGGRDLTNNYYEAIQNKHYGQAYTYLHPQGQIQGLTLNQYLKQAQDLDERYGPVYKYAPGTPSISYDSTGTTIDHFTITVDITREKKSYQVRLTVYKVNQEWKITDYTTI
ncbi:MAG: hypothetical protein NVS2B12_12840 [Ktedonobacteraceae bacterium]